MEMVFQGGTVMKKVEEMTMAHYCSFQLQYLFNWCCLFIYLCIQRGYLPLALITMYMPLYLLLLLILFITWKNALSRQKKLNMFAVSACKSKWIKYRPVNFMQDGKVRGLDNLLLILSSKFKHILQQF